MKIRSRFGVEGKTPLATIASLGAAIRRAIEPPLPTLRQSLPTDMLVSDYLPYQASRTYNRIIVEAACIRAQAMIEVQRMRTR